MREKQTFPKWISLGFCCGILLIIFLVSVIFSIRFQQNEVTQRDSLCTSENQTLLAQRIGGLDIQSSPNVFDCYMFMEIGLCERSCDTKTSVHNALFEFTDVIIRDTIARYNVDAMKSLLESFAASCGMLHQNITQFVVDHDTVTDIDIWLGQRASKEGEEVLINDAHLAEWIQMLITNRLTIYSPTAKTGI